MKMMKNFEKNTACKKMLLRLPRTAQGCFTPRILMHIPAAAGKHPEAKETRKTKRANIRSDLQKIVEITIKSELFSKE